MPQPLPHDIAAVPELIVEIMGYTAGFLTSLAYLPQTIRIARTRSADDISLPTFILLSAGVGLWLLYGLAIRSWPVVAANAVGLAFILSVLFMKLRYSRRP